MAGWRFTTWGQEQDRLEREGRLPPPIDWRAEARFWLSPASYNRRTVPLMAFLAVWLAVGAAFSWHLNEAWHHGSTASAWTAAGLGAFILAPFVAFRLKRGRWPA